MTEDIWGKMIPQKSKGKATSEQEKARDMYLACVFLAGVDRTRYREAMDEFNNDYVVGNIMYPKDVTSMMMLLSNRRDGGCRKNIDDMRDGVMGSSYVQISKKHIKCFACGKRGHIARDCPDSKNEGDEESNSDESARPKTKYVGTGWAG